MGSLLIGLFGSIVTDGLTNFIKDFDFSKMNVKDSHADDYLHLDLAPSFGTLTSESVKLMDDHLKVMIAGTMRELEKARKNGPLTWATIESIMSQNVLVEPRPGKDKIDVHNTFTKEGTHWFKTDGSPDAPVVREVKDWFVSQIVDPDVLQSTKIDVNCMAEIVAQTGATVDSFESFFYKEEEHQKTVVDVGVLRFPDIEHPYFKIYRIQLHAWSDAKRYLFAQVDKNGITLDFNARDYVPRKSVIDDISKEAHDTAVKEANDLFK